MYSKNYPKSVLTMYLKLYCRKRNPSKNKLMEGIKSWLSLSTTEKQKFFLKYKECQIQHKNKLASQLKKAEPFMKKKKNIRFIEQETSKEEPFTDADNLEKPTDSISECHNILMESCKETEPVTEQNYYDSEHGINDVIDIATSSNEYLQTKISDHSGRNLFIANHYSGQELVEPTAPHVRSGKDLFEMLNANNDQNNDTTWKSLSSTQKGRYNRAIILLKNDYITKFKAYLESLSSKALINYYNTFF